MISGEQNLNDKIYKQIFSHNVNSSIMKKTTPIFKSIIAIAAVTIFISCKKEIERPQNNVQGNYKVVAATQVVVALAMTKVDPKTSTGYAGSGTLADSTNTGK